MIHENKTKLIRGKNQNITHVWVTCDLCGKGRWSQPGNAKRLPKGHPCRPCSNKKAWDGKRIDLSDGHRTCTDCGEYKPLTQFSTDRRKRAGVRSYCLDCSAKRSRSYSKNNPKKSRRIKRIAQAKRRAKKRHAKGQFTLEDWDRILANYGHKCLCCGATHSLQPDHVIPLSKGGVHDASNIQPLCGPCNRRKQAETVDYR